VILNHEIRKASVQEEVENWSMLGEPENDDSCDGCSHYRCINQSHGQKACHYLIDTGHRRPCDPGSGCTVKVLGEYPGYDPSD
jgi:hypothetical protein